jgi:peptidoglycan/LPS O-acetylase OafA/YrhL
MAKVTPEEPKVSRRKVLLAVFYALIAAFFSWQFQEQYHNNSNALTVLVTVFSILAGFLIAVMAIVGNERALRGRNWRQDTFYLVQIRRDLKRHAALFYLYLAILALAFLASLNLGWPNNFQIGVECFLLFLACVAMLFSFSLPGQLTKRHIKDLEMVIRTRQEEEIRQSKQTDPR